MERTSFLLLLLAVTCFVSCTKYSEEVVAGPLPVTTAVKTGDWMIGSYFENGINISNDIGLAFIKFSDNGTLVSTKETASYSGTWTETKTANANTFTINIATTDSKLQKANKAWNVTSVTEYFIDLANGTSTMNLMKH